MSVPTIAVVEYDQAIRKMINEIVLDAGYVSHLWPGECEALEFIHAHQPDLVILDLWLKRRGDGLALLKRLWHDARTCATPVLVCTTDTQMLEEYAGVLRARGYDTLLKPFLVDDLLAWLAVHGGGPGNKPPQVVAGHESNRALNSRAVSASGA